MSWKFTRTPWKYDTSTEEGYSGWVISGGEGRVWFVNQNDGDAFSVRYTFIAAGVAKGAIVNYAKSVTEDTSGGFSHVRAWLGYDFGPTDFPCCGWMVVAGGTAGIFQPSFMDQSGGDVAVVLFGGAPFAGIPIYGRFNSLLPSAGLSVYFCSFEKSERGVKA